MRPERSPCRPTPNHARGGSQPKSSSLLRSKRRSVQRERTGDDHRLRPVKNSNWLGKKPWDCPVLITGRTLYDPVRLSTLDIRGQHSLTATLRHSAELKGDAGVLSMVILEIEPKFRKIIPRAFHSVTMSAFVGALFPLSKTYKNKSLPIELRLRLLGGRTS